MQFLALIAIFVAGHAKADGVFYAFSADGIDIINPKSLTVVKQLPHNMVIPNTNQVLCTRSSRYRTPCGWGGATTVNGKYVFAADSYGNRIIVIDVERQMPIKSIPTHGFPYDLTYIAALDEVWVHCWKDSQLDVVGTIGKETALHAIKNASSLMIAHTIKAQLADTYKSIMHGYLRAENCQNVDPNLRYGIVSHFSEPGIHKIDLVNKTYDKFINTSAYGCKSTFAMAYSSVTKYAFVQCLGSLRGHPHRKMLVIDLATDDVIHADDAITEKAKGDPYASPDGRYVLVINRQQIISYYMQDGKKEIKRLKNIPLLTFMPSRVAFVKSDGGYLAYVTSKSKEKILVLNYKDDEVTIEGNIRKVGKAADVSSATIQKYSAIYKPSYKVLLKKQNQPFSAAKFMKYLKKMFYAHVSRPISTGCGLNDHYVASPAAVADKIAIIDGKTKTLAGLVKGVKKARYVLWVE